MNIPPNQSADLYKGANNSIPEMEQSDWYKQIYDLSPSLCLLVNPDGIILDCNLAYVKALGYSNKDKVVGHRFLEFAADDETRGVISQSFETWRRTGKIHNHELIIRRLDGTSFPGLVNATSIHDELGRVIACNAVIVNITEFVNTRKKVEVAMVELMQKEKEVQEANDELKRVEKAKEEFISMVSHELKNPLTPIIAFSDMLNKGIDPSYQLTEEQKKKAIYTINSNAQDMKQLIDDVLSVYKLEMRLKFSFTKVDVVELVDQVLTELSPILKEKGIVLEKYLFPGDGQLHNRILDCDPLRIRQVLVNLIKNSVDFVPDSGGIIKITVDHRNPNSVNSQAEQTDDKNVKECHDSMHKPMLKQVSSASLIFSVMDNGPGIPTEKVPNLFRKFYQGDAGKTRRHGGTGLGLTICKEIVEMHGGKIWYDNSMPNHGSCFRFTILQN